MNIYDTGCNLSARTSLNVRIIAPRFSLLPISDEKGNKTERFTIITECRKKHAGFSKVCNFILFSFSGITSDSVSADRNSKFDLDEEWVDVDNTSDELQEIIV